MACGAPSEERKADKEVQDICDKVKSQAETKAGVSFDKFEAISYKAQVVAGTNYFIKVRVGAKCTGPGAQVKVGDSSYVHLRVFKPLPHAGSTLELAAIKTGMKEGDSLDYF